MSKAALDTPAHGSGSRAIIAGVDLFAVRRWASIAGILVLWMLADAALRMFESAVIMPFRAWVLAIWEGAEFVVARALYVVFVAAAFSRFVQLPAAGIPGFAPDPEELAQTFE